MRSLLLLWFLMPILCWAQDLEYARSVIDLLADKSLYGRGLAKDGHKLTANYISSEFKHFGLRSFEVDYQQPFPLKTNTFFGQVNLKIGNRGLKPGKDFLVDPASPSAHGSYHVISYNLDSLLMNTIDWIKRVKQSSDVIMINKAGYDTLTQEAQSVVDGMIDVLKYNPELKIAALVEVSDESFFWGVSQQIAPRPSFRVKSSSIGDLAVNRVKFNVQSAIKEVSSQNVIGMIDGISDSVIVITAHYDHLGMMGRQTYFPGANDNASGVAMLLDLARYFSFQAKPLHSLLFIAFGGEEAGLVGSRYYVDRPVYPLGKSKFLINLDIVGTGEEGISVVNAKVYTEAFQRLSNIAQNQSPGLSIKARGAACNSDHCSFDRKGIPCFFIYSLGGSQAYHDINDRPVNLSLHAYEDLFHLITRFISEMK